jgi:hypothetical protein
MGRVCFGPWVGQDAKGLPSGMQLGSYAQPYLFNWTAVPLDTAGRLTFAALAPAARALPSAAWNASGPQPALYLANLLAAPGDGVMRDTYLDMRGWGKGIVAPLLGAVSVHRPVGSPLVNY